MPINIDNKTFEDFDAAVEHVKRTKPNIASPEGYVASIERAQKKAKTLLANIFDEQEANPEQHVNTKDPYSNGVTMQRKRGRDSPEAAKRQMDRVRKQFKLSNSKVAFLGQDHPDEEQEKIDKKNNYKPRPLTKYELGESSPELEKSFSDKIKKLKSKVAGLGDYGVESRLNRIKSPLSDKVPFGKENRTQKQIKDDSVDRAIAEGETDYFDKKIRPPKPKQSDRRRIISARQNFHPITGDLNPEIIKGLNSDKRVIIGTKKYKNKIIDTGDNPELESIKKLQTKMSSLISAKMDEARIKIQLLKLAREEQNIAHEHKHSIVFKGAKLGVYRAASLEQQSGKYAKYWLLNAKQTNGNGWGIAQHTARDNMKKFIGRPLVVTAQSWHDEPSEYGESYEHPYLPTNDMNQIFAHQNRFKVGNIIDVNEDKNGDWYATIEMMPKFAMKNLPPFCSPAIYQLDSSEHEGNISKWEALHLAALNENPAYGARIALLKGTCIGTANSCQIQFKGAKQLTAWESESDKFKKRQEADPMGQRIKRQKEINEYIKKDSITPGSGEADRLTAYIGYGVKVYPNKNEGKIDVDLRRKLANLQNSQGRIKASEDLQEHIKNNKNSSREESFNHLFHKKHTISNITYALDKHFGEQRREATDEDRVSQKENNDRRFKQDIDNHVLRSSKLEVICPKKLKEKVAAIGVNFDKKTKTFIEKKEDEFRDESNRHNQNLNNKNINNDSIRRDQAINSLAHKNIIKFSDATDKQSDPNFKFREDRLSMGIGQGHTKINKLKEKVSNLYQVAKDDLLDKITDIGVIMHREKFLSENQYVKPQFQKNNPKSPLLKEVPFGSSFPRTDIFGKAITKNKLSFDRPDIMKTHQKLVDIDSADKTNQNINAYNIGESFIDQKEHPNITKGGFKNRGKISPPKPTNYDRMRIIKAELASLGEETI